MVVDIARLAFGLLIVAFHRPIADFILRKEERLVVLFQHRGVPIPRIPTRSMAHNTYFGLGMFVCLFSLVRLWTALHPWGHRLQRNDSLGRRQVTGFPATRDVSLEHGCWERGEPSPTGGIR
jgi:hypothetical protein